MARPALGFAVVAYPLPPGFEGQKLLASISCNCLSAHRLRTAVLDRLICRYGDCQIERQKDRKTHGPMQARNSLIVEYFAASLCSRLSERVFV